jgi:tRNA threonylcarbamoyladenosine biosynthesis protein TsaE
MDTHISNSPEDTMALGESWGQALPRGLVVGLTGELGAGKTQLVKGLARGLGFAGRVTSPTFALVNEYAGGRLPLFHLDLYRLDNQAQIIGAGLEAYLFDPPGVTVVEWMERWMGEGGERKEEDRARPRCYRKVVIQCVSDQVRHISYEDFGA